MTYAIIIYSYVMPLLLHFDNTELVFIFLGFFARFDDELYRSQLALSLRFDSGSERH